MGKKYVWKNNKPEFQISQQIMAQGKVGDILLNVNFNLQPDRKCTRDRQTGLEWRWKRRWKQCILRTFFMLITRIFPVPFFLLSILGAYEVTFGFWIVIILSFFFWWILLLPLLSSVCSLVLNLPFGKSVVNWWNAHFLHLIVVSGLWYEVWW